MNNSKRNRYISNVNKMENNGCFGKIKTNHKTKSDKKNLKNKITKKIIDLLGSFSIWSKLIIKEHICYDKENYFLT